MKKVTVLLLFCFGGCEVLAHKKYLIYQTDEGYDVKPKDHQKYVHKPQPYHFGYNIKDNKGNSHWHKEKSDENNYRTGSYGYTDAYGIYRHVDYIADHQGYRAKIRTNEPGTSNYHPAHVYMNAEEPPQNLQYPFHNSKNSPQYRDQQEKLHHYQTEDINHNQQKLYHYQSEDVSHNQEEKLHQYEPEDLSHHQQENLHHYQSEDLNHNQQEEYEEYYPNANQKLTYVPIYSSRKQ